MLMLNVRQNREFLPRRQLGDIPRRDRREYRVADDIIEELVDGFERSEWANQTAKSHALSSETQVNMNSHLKKNNKSGLVVCKLVTLLLLSRSSMC